MNAAKTMTAPETVAKTMTASETSTKTITAPETVAGERSEVPTPQPSHATAPRTPLGFLSDADLVAAVRARPETAPAALVMAAVSHLAEAAAGDAAWLAATYPQVDPVRRARAVALAARRRVRLAAGAALLGGPLAPVATAVAVGWIQIRLILGVGAVLGHDPSAPARIEEVLVLLGAHPDAASARASINALCSGTTRTDGLSPVLVRSGSRALLSTIGSRLIPGVGVLTAALHHDGGTHGLMERAVRLYR